MTEEFLELLNDPDLQSERGPGGTLVFLDGDGFCVVGPGYRGEGDDENMGYGLSREEALGNYRMKRKSDGGIVG